MLGLCSEGSELPMGGIVRGLLEQHNVAQCSTFACHKESVRGCAVEGLMVRGCAQVRISRKRILESAAKVFEMYGTSRAVLEIEYFGEVGATSPFHTLSCCSRTT